MRTVTVKSGYKRNADGTDVKDKDGNPVASKSRELVPLRIQVKFQKYNPGEVAGFPMKQAQDMISRNIAVHIDEPAADKPPPVQEVGNRTLAGAKSKTRRKVAK